MSLVLPRHPSSSSSSQAHVLGLQSTLSHALGAVLSRFAAETGNTIWMDVLDQTSRRGFVDAMLQLCDRAKANALSDDAKAEFEAFGISLRTQQSALGADLETYVGACVALCGHAAEGRGVAVDRTSSGQRERGVALDRSCTVLFWAAGIVPGTPIRARQSRSSSTASSAAPR